MHPKLIDWIRKHFGILNPDNCSHEEVEKVLKIVCSDKGIISLDGLEQFHYLESIDLSNNNISHFDLTTFPNLKKLDCSLNPVSILNLKSNHLLESICYYGLRGNKLPNIDFSGNPKLKKIIGGQDGLLEVDLTNNPDIEEVEISLSSDLRNLNLSNCPRLKRIKLWGTLIPYVDLTHNNCLEYVEINYLNKYKGKENVFGTGYPRPLIFVNKNFNSETINSQDRVYDYYTHILVRVNNDSKEEKVLRTLYEMKTTILSIPTDLRGMYLAQFHYKIMEFFNT